MSILSSYITYLGFGILTYKTLHQISQKKQIQAVVEGIQTEEEVREKEDQFLNIDTLKRWVIFISFLFFEPFFFAIAELIPFGLTIVLIIKLLIIFPRFLIHLFFFQLLEQLEVDNYAENKIFTYISSFLKESIIFTLDLISDAVKYVNLAELNEIEQHIDKVNKKIGFKVQVCEKRNSLLSTPSKSPYKSSIQFRQSAF